MSHNLPVCGDFRESTKSRILQKLRVGTRESCWMAKTFTQNPCLHTVSAHVRSTFYSRSTKLLGRETHGVPNDTQALSFQLPECAQGVTLSYAVKMRFRAVMQKLIAGMRDICGNA